MEETQIPPPANPLTLAFNEVVIEWYFPQWAKKNLPAFEVVVTSKTRAPGKNEGIGGAANSAHLHGLARDFVLYRGGKPLAGKEAEEVFQKFIKPTWPGFALNEGDHIHVNLSREITMWAGVFAAAVLAGLGLAVYKGVKSK